MSKYSLLTDSKICTEPNSTEDDLKGASHSQILMFRINLQCISEKMQNTEFFFKNELVKRKALSIKKLHIVITTYVKENIMHTLTNLSKIKNCSFESIKKNQLPMNQIKPFLLTSMNVMHLGSLLASILSPLKHRFRCWITVL